MGFRKFVLFFFFSPPPPSLLILSRQWEMSNAIRRGEDDELQRVSEKEQEKERKRQAERWFGPLTGALPAD